MYVAQFGMYGSGSWGIEGGLVAAIWCWLGCTACDVGAYGFEGRSWRLYFIDKGWMLGAILCSGALIGTLVLPPD